MYFLYNFVLVEHLTIETFVYKIGLFQLDCCGWDGPKEFAYNSEPIDDSCYENLQGNSGILARPSTDDDLFSTKKMKQVTIIHTRTFDMYCNFE